MNSQALNKPEQRADNSKSGKSRQSTSTVSQEQILSFLKERRPLFKRGKIFGLTVKRWYTINETALEIYKSRKAKARYVVKSLLNLKAVITQAPKKEGLPCTKLIFTDKAAYLLSARDEPEKFALIEILTAVQSPKPQSVFASEQVINGAVVFQALNPNNLQENTALSTGNLNMVGSNQLENNKGEAEGKEGEEDEEEEVDDDVAEISDVTSNFMNTPSVNSVSLYSNNVFRNNMQALSKPQSVASSNRSSLYTLTIPKKREMERVAEPFFNKEDVSEGPKSISVMRQAQVPQKKRHTVNESEVSEGPKSNMLPRKKLNGLNLKGKTYLTAKSAQKTFSYDKENDNNRVLYLDIPFSRHHAHFRSFSGEHRKSGSVYVGNILENDPECRSADRRSASFIELGLDDESYRGRMPIQDSMVRRRNNKFNKDATSRSVLSGYGDISGDSSCFFPFGPHIKNNRMVYNRIGAIGLEDAILTQAFNKLESDEILEREAQRQKGTLRFRKSETILGEATADPENGKKLGIKLSVINTVLKEFSSTKTDPTTESPIEKNPDLLKAVELLNNFDLEPAKQIFTTLAAVDYKNKIYLLECELVLLALTGNREKVSQMLQSIDSFLHELKEKGVPPKKEYQEYFMYELAKAESLSLKGVLNCVVGNKLQGVLNFSEAWSIYKRLDLMKQNVWIESTLSSSEKNRTAFGFGAYNFILAQMPVHLLRIVRIIGISPNKSLGLSSLQKCRQEKGPRSAYAALVLVIYFMEYSNDISESCGIIDKGLTDFPKSVFFLWLGSVLSWKYCQPNDVKILLHLAIRNSLNHVELPTFLMYEIGLYYILKFEWRKAFSTLKKVAILSVREEYFQKYSDEFDRALKYLRGKGIHLEFTSKNVFFDQPHTQAVFPYSCHNMLILACCSYELGDVDMCKRWIVNAIIVHRRFPHIKGKGEDDIIKLAEKFLRRQSFAMFTFELFYFLKHLLKLPDDSLKGIANKCQQYVDSQQKSSVNKSTKVEIASGILVKTVAHCLSGDTASACINPKEVMLLTEDLPDEFGYIGGHLLFWVGRAFHAENKAQEAEVCLKKVYKYRKMIFSLGDRVKKMLLEL